MTKKERNTIIVLIIVAFILIVFGGGLFSLFQPTTMNLHQWVVEPSDESRMIQEWKARFRFGDFVGTTRRNFQENVFLNSVFSSEVTINTGRNTFRFVTVSKTVRPGNAFCTQDIDVFKNGVLIERLEYTVNDRKKYFDDDIIQDSWVEIRMTSELNPSTSPGVSGCLAVENQYRLIFSDNAFNINVSTDTRTFIQGENITVFVDIENTLNSAVRSTITTIFSAPTVLGTIIREESVIRILEVGHNQLEFSIPAGAPQSEINIEVTAEIEYSTNNLDGLNFRTGTFRETRCSNRRASGECEEARIYDNAGAPADVGRDDFINLGFVIEEGNLISVSPSPIYLPLSPGESCPNGYTANPERTFCIRDDIRNLTCSILGCPIVNGVPYQCTSSGGCSQTIFINLQCEQDPQSFANLNASQQQAVNPNAICPQGTTCDLGTGLCILSQIFNQIIQCQEASNCPIPCEGKTPICTENNRCDYVGECSSQSFGCNQLGCPSGFTCNSQTNACRPSILPGGINIQLILIGVIGLAIVIFIFTRFRRR